MQLSSVSFLSFGTLIPPQEWLERNSTGDVSAGWTGYRRRKSSSAGLISLFIIRICRYDKEHLISCAVFWSTRCQLIRVFGAFKQVEMKPAFCLPGRQAGQCTWVCHTQTGLWWCTGRLKKWCCQLSWTPAASDHRRVQPSQLPSERPRWKPAEAHNQHSSWDNADGSSYFFHKKTFILCN